MAAEVRNEPDLPEEVTESLENFHQSLEKVEDAFKPLFESSREELREKLSSLERAKLDLVVAYAINSMFWKLSVECFHPIPRDRTDNKQGGHVGVHRVYQTIVYLVTQGVNPKEHPVKQELDRIKKYMTKVKDATEKKQASVRIDKGAAGRFVKSALWQAKEQKGESKEEEENLQDTDRDHSKGADKSGKRKSSEDSTEKPDKTKKRKKKKSR